MTESITQRRRCFFIIPQSAFCFQYKGKKKENVWLVCDKKWRDDGSQRARSFWGHLEDAAFWLSVGSNSFLQTWIQEWLISGCSATAPDSSVTHRLTHGCFTNGSPGIVIMGSGRRKVEFWPAWFFATIFLCEIVVLPLECCPLPRCCLCIGH